MRFGADETTVVDGIGKTTLDYLREQEHNRTECRLERMLKLLVYAPAGRAWRRRGFLVMYRAHHDTQHLRGAESGNITGVLVLGVGDEGIFRTIVGYL